MCNYCKYVKYIFHIRIFIILIKNMYTYIKGFINVTKIYRGDVKKGENFDTKGFINEGLNARDIDTLY